MGVENHGFSFIVNHQDIDVFGLIIYARDWGSMCFALTDEQAYHVAEGLADDGPRPRQAARRI